MSTLELLAINLIFIVSFAVTLAFLTDSSSGGKEERSLTRLLLGGFIVFQGVRWLPFVAVLVGRAFSG